MKRRLVLLACLVGVVGGSAGVAVAADTASPQAKRNELCIVLAKDDAGTQTQDLCITWPGLLQRY